MSQPEPDLQIVAPTRPEKDRPWVMRTYAGHSTAAASNGVPSLKVTP